MPTVENENITALEGETFASKWRSKKAKRQPRDANGRWIAAGANVTYRNSNNERVAGTVKNVDNDRALIETRNQDGSTAQESVDYGDVEVVSSKARLENPENEFYDKENNFMNKLGSEELKRTLDEKGNATITRADGYALEISEKEPKDEGNPYLYQLFAPGGVSLGSYSQGALGTLDKIVDEDKAGVDEPEETEVKVPGVPLGGEAPAGPVVASAVRISRDGVSAIAKYTDGTYRILSKESGMELSEPTTKLAKLTAGGSWRRVLTTESEALVASLTAAKEDIIVEEVQPVTPYRVPASVKEEIASALSNSDSISPEDAKIASTLAFSDSVSIAEVEWINSFFASQEMPQKLRGGYKGQKWASKVIDSNKPVEEPKPKHNFDDDTLSYFAIGDNSDSSEVTRIVAANFETKEVFEWGDNGFSELSSVDTDTLDEPLVIPIDPTTASTFAAWVDSHEDGATFNIEDADPEERNLYELAVSEIDFEEIDRLSAIIADATGYSPVERSVNAKNQPRGAGGKFGQKPDEAKAPAAAGEEEEEATTEEEATETSAVTAKATLPEELPLVLNPAVRIEEWLATAPITAAGEPVAEEAVEEAPETTEAPAEEEATEAPETNNNSKSLYFAIVDEVDKSAVTDVVAITKNDLSQPEAWVRENGDWVPSEDHLATLQGSSPPPVVELDVPDPAQAILSQIDSHDNKSAEPEEETAVETPDPADVTPVAAAGYSPEQRQKDAKKGYAMPSGSYPIHNEEGLKDAVQAYGRAKDSEKAEVKRHIKKRAKALNRMDILPEDWRSNSALEAGEALASKSPLYGEFGEVLIAAGAPGVADTPSDWASVMRLQNYWTRGKGAAKIRWGTKGDLTRAHRHLAKYVGPQRAWGLAQKFHKAVFGVYNHTHDVAVGHYKGRR